MNRDKKTWNKENTFNFINGLVDSPTSGSSFCRQQKALAVLCEVVSSVATVRLTW